MSYGASWGVWWGLGLEVPAWASLPPALIRGQERDGTLPPGSAAQLGGVIVSKRARGTLRPELALTSGPQRLAQPGGGTFAELYGARWALGLYRGGPRLYQAQAGVWADRTDPDALGVLTASGVRHVALAFDQAARPVLAWEQGAQIYIRQWSPQLAQYVTRGPWAGRDPLLICDALLHGDPALSDVLLLHLTGEQLHVRAQVDAYSVPRVSASVPAGAVLDQAVSLPYQLAALGEADRAPLTLLSDLYPVAARGYARGTVSGPSSGALRDLVLTLTGSSNAAQGTVSGPSSGALRDFVLILTGSSNAAQGAVSGPASGVLRDLVLTLTGTRNAAQGTVSGPASGALRVVVLTLSPQMHATAASVTGPSGGAFA